jgi:hypothetical protein
VSNERPPLPAIKKPQYAIAKVQRIMRRLLIGPTSPYGNTSKLIVKLKLVTRIMARLASTITMI